MNEERIRIIKDCLEQIKLTEEKKISLITSMLNGWTAMNSFTMQPADVEEIMVNNKILFKYVPIRIGISQTEFKLTDTPKLIEILKLELTKLENQNV